MKSLFPALFLLIVSTVVLAEVNRASSLGMVDISDQAEQGQAANDKSSKPTAKDDSAKDTAAKANPASPASADKKTKPPLRIGIAQVMSNVDQSLETDGWQQELVNDIDFLGGKGVILNSDPNDREGTIDVGHEQKCDYVVFTTVTNFKSVGVGQKLSSVLNHGGLGGVGGSGQARVEISVSVKVFQPDNVVPVFDGTDDFRQNDTESTARGLVHTEARDIMLQLKKLQSGK